MLKPLKVAFLVIALLLGACADPTAAPPVTRLPPTVTPILPIPLADHFVSLTGADDNPGTETLPWRTIQRAVNLARPSETIFVRGGTYTESLQLTRSGQPGQPLQRLMEGKIRPFLPAARSATG